MYLRIYAIQMILPHVCLGIFPIKCGEYGQKKGLHIVFFKQKKVFVLGVGGCLSIPSNIPKDMAA